MAVLHPSFSASQVVIMILYSLPKTNMAFSITVLAREESCLSANCPEQTTWQQLDGTPAQFLSRLFRGVWSCESDP
jgi:hypothetical protein